MALCQNVVRRRYIGKASGVYYMMWSRSDLERWNHNILSYPPNMNVHRGYYCLVTIEQLCSIPPRLQTLRRNHNILILIRLFPNILANVLYCVHLLSLNACYVILSHVIISHLVAFHLISSCMFILPLLE